MFNVRCRINARYRYNRAYYNKQLTSDIAYCKLRGTNETPVLAHVRPLTCALRARTDARAARGIIAGFPIIVLNLP